MAYGVTAEGWSGKSLEVLRVELEDRLRAELGAGLSLIPQSVLGVIVGEVADMLSEVWAAAEEIWFAFDESAAEDAALDNLCALTGTERLLPTSSTVPLVLTGTASTLIAAGKVVSVQGSGARFATDAAATLVAADSWSPTTGYFLGDRRTNDSNIYEATVAGTSAGSGGPTGTTATQVDGTVTWRWLGAGTAFVETTASAEDTGPVPALAYTLAVIETPVAGWQGASNPTDAELGRNLETNEELRIRRRVELRSQGTSPVDAIRARLLDQDNAPGVTSCTVFENTTDSVNADGMPPHSVEAMVEGGEDQDILDTLFASKAAGIATHGTTSGTVVDASGNSHTVKFSRPQLIGEYVTANVILSPDAPVDDNEVLATLELAVVTFGDSLAIGHDVRYQKLVASVTSISWVEDVEDFFVGPAPAPTGTMNLVMGPRQRASFVSERIDFTLTRLTPADL